MTKVCTTINNNKLKNIVMINIKQDLEKWLVDHITDTIHGLKAEDSGDFNKWAKNFEHSEAEFVVSMEFGNDWEYDRRDEVSEEEASEYADALMKRILDNWYH